MRSLWDNHMEMSAQKEPGVQVVQQNLYSALLGHISRWKNKKNLEIVLVILVKKFCRICFDITS